MIRAATVAQRAALGPILKVRAAPVTVKPMSQHGSHPLRWGLKLREFKPLNYILCINITIEGSFFQIPTKKVIALTKYY